ncbi:chemotaxis protein CheW [Aquabacter sp. CN5-332]|uniref:chemotaxis protein CheW n=1 Tax=Aquabacter sp. CN5-332 TaxID=3156608 RepID=UPI0032B33FEC
MRCGGLRIGVPVAYVRRAVPAPLPVPLAGVSASVAGLVNFHGEPLVVLDPACRGAAARDAVTLNSQIMIIDAAHGPFGLLCDGVENARPLPAQAWHSLQDLMPGAGYLAAGTVADEGLIVLCDVDAWLSHKDMCDLEVALERRLAEVAL